MFTLDDVPDGLPADEGLDRTVVSGDVLFAGSIGRTDLAGRRRGRDAPVAARRRAAAGRLLARAPRSRPGDDDAPRAGGQPLPARIGRVTPPAEKVTPISGFPELLPAERLLELHVLDVGPRGLRAARVRPARDPGRRARRAAARQGRGRRQGDLRRQPARGGGLRPGRRARPALRPHRAVRALRPRERRQAASSRSGATRSRRCGAASGPQEGRFREFTQADIDVVDVGELAPHFEAEMPLVIAEAFRRLPVGEFRIQVNNRKIPEGFYLGIGLTDVAGTLRIVDKLDKIGPEKVAAQLVEAGATAEQARLALALAEIRSEDLSFVEAVRALGVEHPTLDEGLEALAAVMRDRGRAGAGHPGRRPADRPRPRLLHRHRLRDPARRLRGVGLGLLRRALRLARQRRPHHVPGRRHLHRPDPARPPARHEARASPPPGRRRPRSSSRSSTRSRGAGRTAVAAALRARGIPCEVAPSAAKFGKQIRYADRRGIPFVWFPGAGDDGGDQVKDIRSGDQVDADADDVGAAREADLPPVACVTRRAGRDRPGTCAGSQARASRSSSTARARMTSRSPRRHAPAGSSLIRASRGIGWFAIARRAKRSRSGSASTNRCAAVARRTNRQRRTSHSPTMSRIGPSAVVRPEDEGEPLDRADEVEAGAARSPPPMPAADRNGVAIRSSSSGQVVDGVAGARHRPPEAGARVGQPPPRLGELQRRLVDAQRDPHPEDDPGHRPRGRRPPGRGVGRGRSL